MKNFQNTQPTTIDEAIAILESCLEESDKREIMDGDLDELVMNSHFGLGLAIRNAWLYKDCIDFSSLPFEERFTFFDPDSTSEYILRKFYKKVRGE